MNLFSISLNMKILIKVFGNMGLLSLFKGKKEDEIGPMDLPKPEVSESDPLGLPKDRDMGELPDVEPMPMMSNHGSAFSMQRSAGPDSKDVQIIISKLDLINARLENINERLLSLERTYVAQEKRRW